MDTIESIHSTFCSLTGHQPNVRVWEKAYADFIAHGFTSDDLKVCFRYARRENAKFTSAIQGFTITPFKVFDFEYRWFDSLLSQARASERNRRPAPTPKEQALSSLRPIVEPELSDQRMNGTGKTFSDALRAAVKNLEAEDATCPMSSKTIQNQ